MRHLRLLALGVVLLAGARQAQAQDSTSKAAPDTSAATADTAKAEERSTGLPGQVKWEFNLDAGAGVFGFNNSLYTDVRPDPSGNLSDNWWESFVKPGLSASYGLDKGVLYAKISAVGERTFDAPPPIVGSEASSFQVEDLYIGWRSGNALKIGEDALDFRIGRSQYTLGQGMILWDGGGEGGTRGGFWSNARKAWGLAAIGRFKPKNHTFEAFYLDRDEVPEAETGTRLWGANYELTLGEANTLGATYLHFYADSLPRRDGMSVFNLRAYVAPFKSLPNLSFAGEYVHESNGDLLSSNAWYAQGAYELSKVAWKPRISYRYAFFEGDDPATPKDEAFDALIPGFYDWGTWWQGEIGGEYFLANSNLVSHEVRVHTTPSESVGLGLIGYIFRVDQPATFAPGVTSKSIANELDAYLDWKVNGNFTISWVAAFAHPQEAATQGFGRTSDFTYGMMYVAYSY